MSDRPHPTSYEINMWVWLSDRRLGRSIDRSFVPAAEWEVIAKFDFDCVWLMGVGERSPAGSAIGNRNAAFPDDCRRILANLHFEDNAGSAYCVRRYTAGPHLSGANGLATARRELARRDDRLLQPAADPLFHEGTGSLCHCTGRPDHPSSRNPAAWCCQALKSERSSW